MCTDAPGYRLLSGASFFLTQLTICRERQGGRRLDLGMAIQSFQLTGTIMLAVMLGDHAGSQILVSVPLFE